jgi:polyisoprenoid-binding protein YceI
MKPRRKLALLAWMGVAALLAAFQPAPAPSKYVVDTQASTLSWHAKKVTGAHYGKVAIASGELWTEGKNITKGSFVMDMTRITVEDITNKDSNLKLVNHLKSDDFFSAEKFPQSLFEITSVKPAAKGHTVKGKLTIKGITQVIEFPAILSVDGKKLTSNAKIVVDRTQFDIRYRSGSFFDSLGDKMIYDEFELTLELVAHLGKGA